jgi:hypothetical protein
VALGMPGRAAPDIRASGRARAKRDVDVKVVRVVLNPIGVANRVRWMKPAVAIFGRLHNCCNASCRVVATFSRPVRLSSQADLADPDDRARCAPVTVAPGMVCMTT